MQIYTKETHNFIPTKVIIIRNKYGWLWLAENKAQWLQDATHDKIDKDEEKALKILVKNIKYQLKLYRNLYAEN